MKYISLFILSILSLSAVQAQSFIFDADMQDMQLRIDNFESALANLEQGEDYVASKKQLMKGLRSISTNFRNFNVSETKNADDFNSNEKLDAVRQASADTEAFAVRFSLDQKREFSENVSEMRAIKEFFRNEKWTISKNDQQHLEKLHLFLLAAKSCQSIQKQFVQ